MGLYWGGMPRFVQNKQSPYKKIVLKTTDDKNLIVRFDNKDDYIEYVNNAKSLPKSDTISREDISIITKQTITPKTKSIWYPFKSHWGAIRHKYINPIGVEQPNTRYPIYVVTKGRWFNMLTLRELNLMKQKHFAIVEAQELEQYQKALNDKGFNYTELLILPQKYLDEYDTCDDLGDAKSKGPGSARNFCIDHSKNHKRHWVLDDNLDAFHYFTDNEKCELETNATFRACEDFVDRFKNVPVSGMNYYSFCKSTDFAQPYKLNTRIYSCLLIENSSGYRWRGRYNEDTDLSLRVLKDGLCTIQFNAFLCGKLTTQRMRGGNSTDFYDEDGTLPKSQMLVDLHPDVSEVVWKFNRWHHKVNYTLFKKNRLIPIDDFDIVKHNDYGLTKVPSK